jgi:hypothetical protein
MESEWAHPYLKSGGFFVGTDLVAQVTCGCSLSNVVWDILS